jgi:PAS domain S-box-containing protein
MNPDASTDSDVARKQPQDALATSEVWMHAILEAVVDGIISIDEPGAIRTINPAAERLFGYTQDEVIGQNVKILMPSPYREEHDGYLARYLATGEKRIIGIGREVLGRRKDGTTFPMDLSVAEARLGNERIVVGIIRDITERKRAEQALRESEERFRGTFENAAVGIAHEDLAGRFLRFNERFCAILGYPPHRARREDAL